MAITRVITTLPYYTNIPEDCATNTFYFSSVATLDNAALAVLATRLDTFYAAIDTYLSPIVSNTLGTFKFYDMADPEPRTPKLTLPMAPLLVGSSGMAEEVSVCLSYYATPVSGESAARRRGRIFLGPLAGNVLTAASTTSFSQPATAMRSAVASAAAVLADQSEPVQWCVYSPTDQIARRIVGGWVDNAFDTQRRRGRRATSRNTWTGQP